MTKTETNIVLFSITLCWASSYVFMKNLPSDFSSFAYLAITSGIASAIFLVVFFKRLKGFNKSLLVKSFLTSVVLSITLIFEKLGVASIPASQASFIASLNIVIVPVLLLFFRKRPTRNNLLGIAFILAGLFFTSGVKLGAGQMNAGVLYMLAACVTTSVYTLMIDRYAKDSDPLLLGIGQMIFSTVIGLVLWFFETPSLFATIHFTKILIANIFLLAFFAKAYAYIMLMYSQKYANPISVTVIAATEPIITLILASLIPSTFGTSEVFTITKLTGALLIAIGAFCAGTNFLDRKGGHSFDRAHSTVRS
ncbi:DMT family transporter [Fusibacter paucivorans]|uniref:DMT family transporter n=1 Tax=Fusibacter paucivorans TaxID=76009 RepID=A0ABS5PLY4_9FIRM|nr:DMT family transporter [Fusibacter paucivorans]MBS7525366.1 DMT family transporter [Fusibacter paucivorans]